MWWFLGFLAFGLVSLYAMTIPGEIGGILTGITGASSLLSLVDWRLPNPRLILRGIRWRLLNDPRLARLKPRKPL